MLQRPTVGTMPVTALPFHPLANLLPLLAGAETWLRTQTCEGEFGALVADVRIHGVRECVVWYQDQILDGRNRWLAAQVAGVECPSREYTGEDPLGFVVSMNLKRRHMDPSQRAMAAARAATMRQGERTDLNLPSVEGKLSQEQAAQLFNVSVASVERAKAVINSGNSALIQAVERGDISVSNAAEQVGRGITTGVAMHPYAERGLDLYETPAGAVRALLGVEKFDGPIWEPACGPGAIVSVLRAAGHRVIATDLVNYGCPESAGGVDFLAQTAAPDGVTTILTNPTYRFADEFVRHALTLVPRVVMLLRLAFYESVSRSDILDGGQLRRIWVFRDRVKIHRDGRELDGMALAWFVWDREHPGETVTKRISWSKTGDEAPADSGNAEGDIHESVEEFDL